MKTYKKILACLILFICAIIPSVLYKILVNIFSDTFQFLGVYAIVGIISIGFAFAGFYLPQIIAYSKNGLRYKVAYYALLVLGIYTIIHNISASLSSPNDSFQYFFYIISTSIPNYNLIFGLTMLLISKKNYKTNTYPKGVLNTYKRLLAYTVLCVTAVVPTIIFNFILYKISGPEDLLVPAYIISGISSVAFAILGYYIPQLIFRSKKGLRYMVMSGINFAAGIVFFLRILLSAITDSPMSFYYYIFLTIVSILNYLIVYGVTMLILYKINYKKLKS